MDTVQLDINAQIAAITLNRPESLNAFNSEMHADLRQALNDVKKSDARVLKLTGAGRAFCAGQDLSDRQVRAGEEGVDLGQSLEENYNPLIRTLSELEMPFVCAVNGVAAGAGLGIALCSDILMMHERASFALAFSRIGLVPDSGSSWLLARAVGWRRARALALLGGKISSAQALEWGIAWGVYGDDEFTAQTDALCTELAAAPTRGLVYTKKLFSRAATNDLLSQLDEERDYQRLAGRTHDYGEGTAAFMEKRAPRFRGE